MVKKLKRLLIPEFWKIPKKKFKFTVSPRPGPHKKFECIPLLVIVRDILQLAESWKEARKIIKSKEVFVDGKVRKDHAYPCGLMDTISIPKINKYFRIVIGKKGLELKEISEEDSKKKICKIVNKTCIKGKIQLNLHDGRNIQVEKNHFRTGDSVLIELPYQKILEYIKLEKDALALITKGSNAGKICKVKSLIKRKSLVESSSVICEVDGKDFEIRKDFLIVIGKDKPVVEI
ncbi:MAG: 30S ribosomal protein S4e [Candidatus Aenigmatarchaeota archaeon]